MKKTKYPWLICVISLSVFRESWTEGTFKNDSVCSKLKTEDNGFYVFLTMNAEATVNWRLKTKVRQIELNWTLPPFNRKYDWVGLFRKDPMKFKIDPIVAVSAFGYNGYYLTRYKFPKHPFHGVKSPHSTCLFGFWIAYVSGNSTLKSNCFRLRPTWMWEERQWIKDIPLKKIMIPGTHNSGAYSDFDLSSINILYRYSVNQGEDVWNQLLYGIRYLDLRVGYYKNTAEKFWAVHDFVKMNPLYEIVNDVRRFLLRTNEVVIMDFHRFPTGFDNDNDRHSELVRFLVRELGEFMVPDWVGRNASIEDLWKIKKTLIVTYAHNPTSAHGDLFWPEVYQSWANTRDGESLRKYIDSEMKRKSNFTYLWASMTHLTISAVDIFLNLDGGIRSTSDEIARNVTEWYRDEWWKKANIVATDFFLGNNVIEESIRANRMRFCLS